jgi:ubiquilin
MKIHTKIGNGETLEWEVHPEFGVLDLKALLEDSTGLAISEQRILHKGRALRDEDTLQTAGVADGTRLYVTQYSGTAASENVDASSFVPQPGQVDTANDGLAQMMNSPLVSSMLDNPEVLRSMLQANPQMREMMESNPELAHLFNDPQVLRQSLATSRNPQVCIYGARTRTLSVRCLLASVAPRTDARHG